MLLDTRVLAVMARKWGAMLIPERTPWFSGYGKAALLARAMSDMDSLPQLSMRGRPAGRPLSIWGIVATLQMALL
jgi:hypothetical protein